MAGFRARRRKSAASTAPCCGRLDGRTDAAVRAAPADVQDAVDVVVGQSGSLLINDVDGRHDLTALAEPALRYVLLYPGLLHRMEADAVDVEQALDRGDGPAVPQPVAHQNLARHHRVAVQVNDADVAVADAAAVLRAR